MPTQQQSRLTRRAVIVALLAATAATGAVFLIKQDARAPAAAAGGTDAIVGGEEAPDDQFPWMVSLQIPDDESDDPPAGHFCGGTLIRPDTVLTAAHCFNTHTPETVVASGRASIGSYNHSKVDQGGTVGWEPEVRSIASVTIHPDWNSDIMLNDIAIVKLTEPS